jgi:release factor glutamine methyltransferase
MALFVPDKNPWIFYEKILSFAGSHLKENGKIYVEIHENHAEAISSLFENTGWATVTRKDIYGKERLVSAWRRHP